MKKKTCLCFLSLAWFPLSAASDEDLRVLVKELSQQVKQLSSRVNQLEHRLAQEQGTDRQTTAENGSFPKPASVTTAVTPASSGDGGKEKKEAKPVTAGDVKGTFKIPGTDTSLAIGGYVKLDVSYNSVSAGPNNYADLLLIPSAIPVIDGPGEHSEVLFNARESRLWLKSFTPTAWGDLGTYLEMDFYAFQVPGEDPVPGNKRSISGYSPRLRHAYGSLGNLLAGQTWSTFMNVSAVPETNDHGGPVGQIFVRQPLIRWTQPFAVVGTPMEFQAALESPDSTLTRADGSRSAPDDSRYPDAVVRLNYNPDWGNLSLAGLARQIRIADNDQHHDSAAWGGALSLAGRIKLFELDNIRFMFNYGNALGRYTSLNVFNDGSVDRRGNIALNSVYGGFLSYQHYWTPSWRSTLAYGFGQIDNPGFVAQSVSQQVQSVHVNLLWSPLLQTTIGLEYIYALRELEDGRRGDLQRVQFSTRFNF